MFNLWAQGWGAHLGRNESMYSKERRRMKLYWRIKIDGKWTFIPAVYDLIQDRYDEINGCEVLLWWPTDGERDETKVS